MLQPVAIADVVFTGTVTPGTPGEVGPTDTVTVGPLRDAEPAGDPRGMIAVDGGSELEAGSLFVGDNAEALAVTRVSGFGSRIHVSEPGDFNTPTLGVGFGGSGYLEVTGGGWVSVGQPNQSGTAVIGSGFVPGRGLASVAGEGSLLTIGRQLLIGGGVEPGLEVSDGGVVRVDGEGVEVRGTLELTGQRTELQTSWVAIGEQFPDRQPVTTAVVRVSDGAIVRSHTENSFRHGAMIANNGELLLDGGVFALPIDSMRGLITGSGTLGSSVGIDEPGRLVVGAGERIEVQGSIASTGKVTVADGALDVLGHFENRDVNEYVGRAEFVRSDIEFAAGLTNRGSIDLTDSLLRIGTAVTSEQVLQQGEVFAERSRIDINTSGANQGTIELIDSSLWLNSFQSLQNRGRVVLQQSRLDSEINPRCCVGGLQNEGALDVRSGHNVIAVPVEGGGSLVLGEAVTAEFQSASFFGGVNVGAGATASFEDAQIRDLVVALTGANTERASLVVAADSPQLDGQLDLSGRLEVSLDDANGVSVDQVYKLVEADRLFGDFSEYSLPELPGDLEFLPELTDTELSLRVIDSRLELPGDFTGDGRVDAADYTLWRDGLPGGSRWLDHAMWTQNYGRSNRRKVSAFEDATSIPEPTGLLLLGTIAVGLGGFRRAA